VAELRDYQRETIDDFESLVAAGARSVLVTAPTGSGKNRHFVRDRGADRRGRAAHPGAPSSPLVAPLKAAGLIARADAYNIAGAP
jgi:hypothetical protein